MRFLLTGYDGRGWELPEALGWKLRYGSGTPCDSFEVTCAWGDRVDQALAQAVEFTAERDGETVFRGLVDEYECVWDGKGSTLEIAGRGMAARLLDNEAESADYQVATLEDILRDHVAPYGIETAGRGCFPAVQGFSVESGQSEWQVLRSFTGYYGGVEPRFDRTGRLVLDGWGQERRLVLNGRTAMSWRWKEKRYGRLSEVLVRDRVKKTAQRVVDREFLEQGGQCRRVITMPGESTGSAMRYSGAYQIARAKRGTRQLELKLAGAFAAWPGDVIELAQARPELSGTWRVTEAVSALGTGGDHTELTLEQT